MPAEDFLDQQSQELYFHRIGLVVRHHPRRLGKNLEIEPGRKLDIDIGRNPGHFPGFPPDDAIHEVGNRFTVSILESIRTEIRYLGNEERSPEILAFLDLSLDEIEFRPSLTPFSAPGQPLTNISCRRMPNVQKHNRTIVYRGSQSSMNGIAVQHRIASGEHACSLPPELPNEIPQRSPGANVAPAVGQFIEAIDHDLDCAASDEGLQLFFDEAGTQARKSSCDTIAQGSQHLATTLDMQQQRLSQLVRRRRGSTANDTLNQMSLADAGDAVDDKYTKPVFRAFQPLANALESQLGRFVTTLDFTRVRQVVPELSGLRVREASGDVHLRAGQAAKVGEVLADQQSLEAAKSALSGASQRLDGSVVFTPNRYLIAVTHKARCPPVGFQRFRELFERIREELKVIEFLMEDVSHGTTLLYGEIRSLA